MVDTPDPRLAELTALGELVNAVYEAEDGEMAHRLDCCDPHRGIGEAYMHLPFRVTGEAIDAISGDGPPFLSDLLPARTATTEAESWAAHRERCHDNNPDATIAFLHSRLDAAEGLAAVLDRLPQPFRIEHFDGLWEVALFADEEAMEAGRSFMAKGSTSLLAAALAATGGEE